MFFDYVKEKEGYETIQAEGGFLSYVINGQEFYIGHFYVAPSHRKSPAHFVALMREAFARARAADASVFSCHVALASKNANALLISYLKFGFEVRGQDHFGLVLTLPLERCEWLSR